MKEKGLTIVYIATQIKGGGGVARIVSQKTAEFVALGHQIYIISTNDMIDSAPFYSFDFKVNFILYPNKVRTLFDLHSYYRFIQQICTTQFQPDLFLVIDNGIKGYFSGFYLRKIAPVYFEVHGSRHFLLDPISSSWKRKIVERLTAGLTRYFDGIILLNERMRKDWNHQNLIVLPNWIERKLWNKSGEQTEKSLQIVAIGRLVPEKNYEMLLTIWKQIIEVYPNWKLVICGGGSEEYTAILKEQGHVSIDWKGEIEDLSGVLEASSFMIHTSKMEGMPMAFLEGMASKLGVIAFDIDFGPSDIIQDGKNGFLVPFGNQQLFISRCVQLIEDSDKRLAMGEHAYETIARFEKQVILNQWIQFFDQISLPDEKLKAYK